MSSDRDIGLQTRRNLERFLFLAGIREACIEPQMRFAFPDHQLLIEVTRERLSLSVTLSAWPDEAQMLALIQRLDIRRMDGQLVRALCLQNGVALNVWLPENSSAEQITALWRILRHQLISILNRS